MTKHYYNWSKLERRYFVNGNVLGVVGTDGLAYHYFIDELEEMRSINNNVHHATPWDLHLPRVLEQLHVCRVATPPVAEKPTGWQPIDKAPKDGTVLDLWVNTSGDSGERFPDSIWSKDFECWLDAYGVDVLDGCDENAKVTHFMYLPAAPESHA